MTQQLGVLMSPPAPRGREWHSAGFNNRLQGFAGVAYRRKFITDEWYVVRWNWHMIFPFPFAVVAVAVVVVVAAMLVA